MEGIGNQRNSNKVILSPEQMKSLMTYIISQMQSASQQNIDEVKDIITQVLKTDFSLIEEKFRNIEAQLQQLELDQINQDEVQEASNEVFPIIDNEEAQKRIAKSVDQKLVDKFKNLPPVKKHLLHQD